MNPTPFKSTPRKIEEFLNVSIYFLENHYLVAGHIFSTIAEAKEFLRFCNANDVSPWSFGR